MAIAVVVIVARTWLALRRAERKDRQQRGRR
jgi:hypothetical protein